jgi:predicted short-subunit dehydrogenase-like oxidoreductase (DUF2520 family)
MGKSVRQKVVIIGCGNVAWHIAKHLRALKNFNVFVYNHKANPLLTEFRSKLNCHIGLGLDEVPGDAAYYFICVTDKFISSVAGKLNIKDPNALLVHTSGSTKLRELGSRIHGTGVFYPLQTFSRHVDLDWSRIPVLIESASPDSEKALLGLAGQFSKTVVTLPYKDRLKMHLAAVLVNNFTNALYVSAFDLVNSDSAGLSFDLLQPLIEQSTLKVSRLNPRAAQTGPAKRKDEGVMKKHLALLSKQPDLKKLYKQLSKLIIKQQENSYAEF